MREYTEDSVERARALAQATRIDVRSEAALRRLWDRLHDDEAHQLLATLRQQLVAVQPVLEAARAYRDAPLPPPGAESSREERRALSDLYLAIVAHDKPRKEVTKP